MAAKQALPCCFSSGGSVYLGVTKPEPTAAVTASGCTPKPNFRSTCLRTLSLGSIILGRVVKVRRACAYRLRLSVNRAVSVIRCVLFLHMDDANA